MRTRGALSRAYRSWDLKRTVRRAEKLICISNRTRADLIASIPASEKKAIVAWLGPGIVPPGSFKSSDTGVVLLIGGAKHKQNELAATVLAETVPGWLRTVEGVGVSSNVKRILEAALGAGRCTWHDGISDEELLAVYRRAEYFVLLSVEEGFGMPYVEALASGCKVVAIDQALTREILGEAGSLLRAGTKESLGTQLLELEPPDSETRQRQAARYSWQGFAEAIESSIRELD